MRPDVDGEKDKRGNQRLDLTQLQIPHPVYLVLFTKESLSTFPTIRKLHVRDF